MILDIMNAKTKYLVYLEYFKSISKGGGVCGTFKTNAGTYSTDIWLRSCLYDVQLCRNGSGTAATTEN